MANKKPFHESVTDLLHKMQETGQGCDAHVLFDLIAVTKVPEGEGVKLVVEILDTVDKTIAMEDDSDSAARAIFSHGGRSILEERFKAADPEKEAYDILLRIVREFNKLLRPSAQPIKIPEDDEESEDSGEFDQAVASLEATEIGEESSVPVGEALKALEGGANGDGTNEVVWRGDGDANNQSLDFLARGGTI